MTGIEWAYFMLVILIGIWFAINFHISRLREEKMMDATMEEVKEELRKVDEKLETIKRKML